MMSSQRDMIPKTTLISKMRHFSKLAKPWFSIQLSIKDQKSYENLIQIVDRFLPSSPLFFALNPCNQENAALIDLANVMVNFCGANTCLQIKVDSQIDDLLMKNIQKIQLKDVIFDFQELNSKCVDLIKLVRSKYFVDSTYSIGIIGRLYDLDNDYDKMILLLKEMIENGADYVLSSSISSSSTFIKFVRDCRSHGIHCPIIAHIDPSDFNPQSDDRLLVERCASVCEQILKSELTNGLFLETSDTAFSEQLLKRLKMWSDCAKIRYMPWRQSPKSQRFHNESVRPIFWSTRVKSYFHKTSSWENFPRNSWNNTNLNFSNLPSISDQIFYHHWNVDKNNLRNQWGHKLKSELDIQNVFVSFLNRTKNPSTGCLVEQFPWCEENGLMNETSLILKELIRLNERGVFTINSQPNVNGVSSSDSIYGWGLTDGYVYQKAYLEFFLPKKMIGSLLTILRQYPNVNFHIVSKNDEDTDINNHKANQPIAVTWGVFPGCEIQQPTVVDATAFRIWKVEAYDIWIKRWAVLYTENSQSYKLIKNITETYSLVNLVDNDYPNGNCLFSLMDKVFAYENREYDAQQIFAV